MASAVYSESQLHRPLSLSLEAPPSSSPFPSPSSSFLPPPMPGAHEFAVKPPPASRNGRKSSMVQKEEEPPVSAKPLGPQANGTTHQVPEAMTPTTPTPSAIQHQSVSNGNKANSISALPSPTLTATPTAGTTIFPESIMDAPTVSIPQIPTTPSNPSFYAPPSPSISLSNGNPLDNVSSSPTPNRPAPPSPAVSRRVSTAPSTSSVRSKSSKSSRPPSAAVSRNNSTRKPSNACSSSPTTSTNRLSTQLSAVHNHSPTFSFLPPSSLTLPAPVPVTTTAKRTSYVKIRDFGFPGDDERHMGLGKDVPRANKVARLNRALKGGKRDSTSSYESSDEDNVEDEDDGSWGGFKSGLERFSMNMGAGFGGAGYASAGRGGTESFPSQTDLARNFLSDGDGGEEEEEEEFYDPEGDGMELELDGEEEEEPLYPGLYRALYAFEPEGTAEMALEEDQIVRVVGRGGGVGWAVVVDEREGAGEKHALVPESYLEAVRLDWEDAQP